MSDLETLEDQGDKTVDKPNTLEIFLENDPSDNVSFSQLLKDRFVILTEEQEKWVDEVGLALQDTYAETVRATNSWPNDQIPDSAEECQINDRQRRKHHVLESFDTFLLLRTKEVFHDFTNELIDRITQATKDDADLSENDEIQMSLEQLRRVPEAVAAAKHDYVEWTEKVVPWLKIAVKIINRRAQEQIKTNNYKGEVVIGNGADVILYAMRSSRWGTKLQEDDHVVKVAIGRGFIQDYGEPWPPRIKRSEEGKVRQILEEAGVQPDGTWIDTGYYGSIPVALIETLDPTVNLADYFEEREGRLVKTKEIPKQKIPPKDRNKHILLLKANEETITFMDAFLGTGARPLRSTEGITVLTPQISSRLMEMIDEDRARFTETPTSTVDTIAGPRTEVVRKSPLERLRAYAIQQSIVREFLPQSRSLGPINIPKRNKFLR